MHLSFKSIDELLADPLIQSMMHADRVNAAEFRELLYRIARRRQSQGADLRLAG